MDKQKGKAQKAHISECDGSLSLPRLMTKPEVADMLCLSRKMIEILVKEKRLRAIYPTGRRAIRFIQADVEKLLIEKGGVR